LGKKHIKKTLCAGKQGENTLGGNSKRTTRRKRLPRNTKQDERSKGGKIKKNFWKNKGTTKKRHADEARGLRDTGVLFGGVWLGVFQRVPYPGGGGESRGARD